MKKIYILTAVFALLTLSLNAQELKVDGNGNVVPTKSGQMMAPNRATVTGSVIAADGTSTSDGYQYLPVYGYFFESAQTNQMIYTATQLNGLQPGDKITSLTFYPNGNIAFSGGRITLSLGCTSISEFSTNSALNVSTTQVASTTTYPVSNGGWTITFTNPFTYTGENLLVQVATTSGNFGRTYFYGQDQSKYQSRNSYGSTNRYYFLPKIKLDYERSSDPSIAASNNSFSFNCMPGETPSETLTVLGLNLTEGITASISGTDASLFDVNPSSLSTSGGNLTVTYSPTAIGTHSATLTLSSTTTGTQPVDITLNGTCALELTICDGGSTTTSNLPVYGLWYDAETGQKNQMIYPSSELTRLVGKDITSMTFYAPNGIGFSNGSVTFSIGTTNTSSFSTATALTDNVTPVATVVPQGETEWTITFSAPYTYNGGNLLVQVDTEKGNYASTNFSGKEMGSNLGFYSYNSSNYTQTILPKVTFAIKEDTNPRVTVSPDALTISDSGTNNSFNTEARNIYNGENLGVTPHNGFSTTCTSSTNNVDTWGFYQNNGSVNGTVAVTYTGLNLSASDDISVGTLGASTTVHVDYVPDLYIVTDNGENTDNGYSNNNWVFTNGTQMTNNDGTYTATFTATVDNTYILFARKLGNDVDWNTRYVFGPSSDGTWSWGTYTGGNIDVNDDDPIKLPAGTYTITIDANAYTFTITKLVPDLEIALSAPASIVGGNTATVTATVTNNGDLPATGYTVTFTADGTTISTQNVNVALAVGATATFTADYATTAAQVGSTVSFAANVACTDDANVSNNNATASMNIISMPPPENVVATGNSETQTATVTWDAPSNLPTETGTVNQYVTEDFEDQTTFPPFTTGGIDANNHYGAFGDWTLYDATGARVYGSKQINYNNENEPHAWFVFRPSAATPDDQYPNATAHAAHNNSAQYLESLCPLSSTGYASNHWLISPELSGNAQTITWWDCELTTEYGNETYEVWVSTTDNDPSSFTKLGDTYSIGYTDWRQQSVQLPQGTKYFALRHTSNDIFGVLVDDITYAIGVPGQVTIEPESYNVYLDGQLVGNVDSSDPLSYTFNNVSYGEHQCQVSAVYPGPIESALVPATFIILPTPNAPTVIPATGDANVIITITPAAPATSNDLVYDVIDQNGNHSQDLTWPRGETDYVVTVHAYTTATSNYNQSPEAVVPVTVPALPATAAPEIAITSTTETEVTITATGNGTVTLNIPGYPEASGTGSASITVPRNMEDYVVTATATAKETNHPAGSTTENITIPGRSGQGWMLMDGDYLNGSDQLSFIDALTQEPILFIDQYSGDTEFNAHPASYKYTLEEVTADNPKKSGEVPIYIPKIDSKLTGVYTQDEVDNDDYGTATEMTPDVVNGTMSYKIAANDSVAFYGLYRGDAGVAYPELNDSHMISKLRQFGEQGSWYFDEMVSGKSVSPVYQDFVDYDEVDVVRWDQDYLQDSPNGTGTYVPVIWISAMSTGRKDMIDNSYGSDIKEVVLGDVEPTIYLVSSGNSAWGKWKYQGQDYMVYNPQLAIEGLAPADAEEGAKDGDQYIYTPYMYRAWLKYSGARYYTRNADGHLEDAGEMPSLIPLGSVMITSETEDPYHVELGERWDENNPTAQIPNSFGAPANLRIDDLEFIVRFYYKKTVAEAPNGSKLAANRDGDAKGEYYIVEKKKSQGQIITAVDEFFGDRIVVDVTYVNALGQQSSKPFDGVNIIVTRYSDGTTTTTKVVR